jgi:hypothetical protein
MFCCDVYIHNSPSTIQSYPEYDIYSLWIYIELCGALPNPLLSEEGGYFVLRIPYSHHPKPHLVIPAFP